MIQQPQSEGVQEPLQTNSCIYALKTHFNIQNEKQANKIFHLNILNKILAEEDKIKISTDSDLQISISLKNLERPLHLIKIKKRIGKRSRKVSYKITNCKIINKAYESEDMCDFVNTTGSEMLYGQKKYALQKQDIYSFIKEKLGQKIFGNENNNLPQEDMSQNRYINLIKPEHYLKSYNLVPPSCDMFVRKIKQRQINFHIISQCISFDQAIPQSSLAEIPQNIKQSQLFETISQYLKKRPSWLKNVLVFKLKQDGFEGKYTANELKNVLRYLCFTYKNGPWKHTFCMFGFNPLESSKSVVFQNVSLKLKKKEAEDYEESISEEVYDPTFEAISTRCIRGYQLCDISNQEIQEIVKGKLVSEGKQCTKDLGWLSQVQHGQILKIMKKYVESRHNDE